MAPGALLSVLAAAQASVPAVQVEGPGLLVATDQARSTSARLIETADAIRFEITAPVFVVPSVSIDLRRNGQIDPDEDFSVSSAPGGAPCIARLLAEGRSSPCGPLGEKAQLERTEHGKAALTKITLPKRAISSDGFGFGFAITLFDEKDRQLSSLGGGDYRFGGTLNLVRDGPNFTGGGIGVPAAIMAMVQRYQACLSRSTDDLVPLDRSKLDRLRAVPTGCADTRVAAIGDAVAALGKSGVEKAKATTAVAALFDRIDADFSRLIEALEHGP